MRSGGKREGEEVRSFKNHSCPLYCRSAVLDWTVQKNPTHDYTQSELSAAGWPKFLLLHTKL